MRPADADFRRRLAAADHAAFSELHRRLNGGLRAMFVRRSARLDVAEELTQQVWHKAWEALRAGHYQQERSAPSTYVYAIANHVWLQYLDARRRAATTTSDPPAGAAADASRKLMEFAELLDALRACLRSANPSDAELASLLSDGLSEREIASRLGIAASTLHVRKQGLLARLRHCLKAKGFQPESIEQEDLRME